jgi:hypothetical protein
MISSLIIEGCDATGKDTLIRQLLPLLPEHVMHPRASTSLGGPVSELDSWTADSVSRLEWFNNEVSWIFNRHPLISEPIYSAHRRVNRGMRGLYLDDAWRTYMLTRLARHATMVICQPPLEVVRKTMTDQGPDAHMPGVYTRWTDIYEAYATWIGPLRVVRYDYTRNTPTELVSTLTNMETRRGNH